MIRAEITLDRALGRFEICDRLYGSFVEHLGRAIYGGVYEPGHPEADADGFRKDVLGLVRELGVPIIRYPGGNYVSAFNWEDGVGPAASRPRRLDLAWRSTEPNAVGPREFHRWAGKAGSEVMMALNLGTRGIEESRAFVEYCNHPGGSAWADLRRSHGSPDPFGFKVWCLGNEMDGPWQVGYKSAEEYGKLAEEVGKALKLFDPSLELVACGSSGPGMPTFPQWEATVLERCLEHVDFISLHTYAKKKGDDLSGFLASSMGFERSIRDVAATIDFVQAKLRSKRKIKISIDEWNVWYHTNGETPPGVEPWAVGPSILEEPYTMEDALVVGCFLISLIRCADRVGMACLAQLVNALAPIMTRNGGPSWRQTTFYPFLHASRYGRGESMETRIESPAYEADPHGQVPYVDAVAVMRPGEEEISLFCVNRHLAEGAEISLRLGGFGSCRLIERQTLSSADPLAVNTMDAPETVVPKRYEGRSFDGETATIAVPPLSWNMIRLGIGIK
jgi:alpha-N-arabinofuranosidase